MWFLTSQIVCRVLVTILPCIHHRIIGASIFRACVQTCLMATNLIIILVFTHYLTFARLDRHNIFHQLQLSVLLVYLSFAILLVLRNVSFLVNTFALSTQALFIFFLFVVYVILERLVHFKC
jgi:hypothetical protein